MKDEPTTLPGIRVSRELHKRIKYFALLADQTQQEYLDSVIPPLPADIKAHGKGKP